MGWILGRRNKSKKPAAAAAEENNRSNDDQQQQQQEDHEDNDNNEVLNDAQTQEKQLSELLSALAAGARAVSQLPVTRDDFDFEQSFPEFRSSLSEASNSMIGTIQHCLENLASVTLNDELDEQKHSGDPSAIFEFNDLDDPVLWERTADACDALMDQVELFLIKDNNDDGSAKSGNATDNAEASAVSQLQQWSNRSRQRADSSYSRMLAAVQDIPKPQDTYNIPVRQNSRTQPFVPAAHPDKPYGIRPLEVSLQLLPGHGLESRYPDGLRKNTRVVFSSEDAAAIVAPAHHVANVYEHEIQSFAYLNRQLQAVKPTRTAAASQGGERKKYLIPVQKSLEAIWIDTEKDLKELGAKLLKAREIAIDLEAHSYRSFSGLVCLMQISIRDNAANNDDDDEKMVMSNYLIDTLALNSTITTHLQPALANPDIVKVMHGADSDIVWLQRDFGCYIVNLFDTGRAARSLQFSSASYAYLLQRYVNIAADKSFQLADWRQRPLPEQMQHYAIQDTHYLLDIYERLKWELQQHPTATIEAVLDVSRLICLSRYCQEPFSPMGYKRIMLRGGRGRKQSQTAMNDRQEEVLKSLWDWRDNAARIHDESLHYLCTNQQLLRLALASPVTVQAMQGLFNPMPPFLLRSADQVLQRIRDAVRLVQEREQSQVDENSAALSPVGAPSSAFFKPAKPDEAPDQDTHANEHDLRGSMLSPVLGTEALYKQAGWMTPIEDNTTDGNNTDRQVVTDAVICTTSESEEDDTAVNVKPRHRLSIHSSNKNYNSKQGTDHSLELKDSSTGGGDVSCRSVDGMGAARAVRESSLSPTPAAVPDLEEQRDLSRENSARIRSGHKASLPVVLGLISSSTDIDQDDTVDGEETESKVGGGGTATSCVGASSKEGGEFIVPTSMREIYKISNRNRRNKKAASPTPERGATPTDEREREELANAEALLKERGLLSPQGGFAYFDENPASLAKRPRTKSAGGRDSEECVPQDSSSVASKEDDLVFMQNIGWIKSKNELEDILGKRFGNAAQASTAKTSTTPTVGGNEVSIESEPPLTDNASTGTGGGSQVKDSVSVGSRNPTPSYDYSTVGAIGVMQPNSPTRDASSNPFFSGAAMVGGPLAQGIVKPGAQRTLKKATAKEKQKRKLQQERAQKNVGQTFAYRSG